MKLYYNCIGMTSGTFFGIFVFLCLPISTKCLISQSSSTLKQLSLHRYSPILPKRFQNSQIYRNEVSFAHSSAAIGSSFMSPLKLLSTVWKFSRPHTVIGSFLSIVTIFLFATPPSCWGSTLFLKSLISALAPSLLMNLYITGLNQVTDVEIDKINKPYLPIAAGLLTLRQGVFIVLSSLVISFLMGYFAAIPLQLTLLGSAILGTAYSLPPLRLKRFPLLAAFCILVVRGSVVNLGFFFQVRRFY